MVRNFNIIFENHIFVDQIINLQHQKFGKDTMNDPKISVKRLKYFQILISLLFIFKPELNLNVYLFYSIVIALFVVKYFKTGNTIGTFILYFITLIMILGDAFGYNLARLMTLPIILNYFFLTPSLYTLPEFNPKRNGKDLYWVEWGPVEQKQNQQLYQVPWNYTNQIGKMTNYSGLSNKYAIQMLKFFWSSGLRYNVTYAKGAPAKHKGVILFSHGRSGTPFFYSSVLRFFARSWKILSPQHSEVQRTKFTDMKEIKKFREVQVKQRAEEIIFMANQVPQSEDLVLMGHSYGGATVLQAYNLMQPSIKNRVSKIILLDPWLFPLPEEVLRDEIACPILMLANEHFVEIKQVYERNKIFVKRHGTKILFICWKDGDHGHQTDIPFVIGNMPGINQKIGEGAVQLRSSIQAIEMFLDYKKVGVEEIEQFKTKFGKQDLTLEFTPKKWDTIFTF